MKNDDRQDEDILDNTADEQDEQTNVTSDSDFDPEEDIEKDTQENTQDETIEDVTVDEDADLAPQDKIKKLREQLKSSLAEKQSYLESWQREKAEFVNIRKRDEESKQDFVKFAESQLVEELIPVLDSCVEALKVANSKPEASEWAKGIKSMYSKILSVCEKRGLKEYGEVGDKFDPTLHQSVSSEKTEDNKLDETIASVLQKGYKLKDRVIRPALVAVYQV